MRIVQFVLLRLQFRSVFFQFRPDLLQISHDLLIVLHNCIDKIDTTQQVIKAAGLKQDRPVGQRSPFLFLPHLLAELFILLFFGQFNGFNILVEQIDL